MKVSDIFFKAGDEIRRCLREAPDDYPEPIRSQIVSILVQIDAFQYGVNTLPEYNEFKDSRFVDTVVRPEFLLPWDERWKEMRVIAANKKRVEKNSP